MSVLPHTDKPDDMPRHIIDGWGNTWRYFSDRGYLRLQVTTDPGRTLVDIVQQTGSATALVEADPMALLRQQVEEASRV